MIIKDKMKLPCVLSNLGYIKYIHQNPYDNMPTNINNFPFWIYTDKRYKIILETINDLLILKNLVCENYTEKYKLVKNW